MRIRDVGLSLLGSAVVYVTMAACSAGGGSPSGTGAKSAGAGGSGSSGPVASAGTSGTSGANGTSGASSTSGAPPGTDSGLIDALTDPVPTAKADPTDGTRLKATYRLAGDGSKEYVPGIWFDTQRNETCSFTAGGDGQQRCLPSGSQGGMFADSSCTQPIAAVPTGCTAPTYAATLDSATCGAAAGGMHIFALGAAASPTQLYIQTGTQCFAAGAASSGYTYYGVGAEIPPATFVAATTNHD